MRLRLGYLVLHNMCTTMSQTRKHPLVFLLALLVGGSWACDTEIDNPIIPPVEEEPITKLIYSLDDPDGLNYLFFFQDLDGDGGSPPILTMDTLDYGVPYQGTMLMYDDTENPIEDITLTIDAQAKDYQIFFELDDESLANIFYLDADQNGRPVGLLSQLITQAPGESELTISLIHQPNKTGIGVQQGDPSNAGGKVEIEVSFPFVVRP